MEQIQRYVENLQAKPWFLHIYISLLEGVFLLTNHQLFSQRIYIVSSLEFGYHSDMIIGI